MTPDWTLFWVGAIVASTVWALIVWSVYCWRDSHPKPKRSDVDIEATAYARGYQDGKKRMDTDVYQTGWDHGWKQHAYIHEKSAAVDVF